MRTDRDTYEDLLRPALDGLYRFAYRLVGDKSGAEDLLQQAVLQGLERLSSLDDHRAFRAWQARILYRIFLNNRARKRPVTLSGDAPRGQVLHLSRDSDSPSYAAGRRRLSAHLSEAFEALPEDQRVAVWLVDAQGYRFAEAAQILGLPSGTVASRVARGRIVLRTMLKQVARDQGVAR